MIINMEITEQLLAACIARASEEYAGGDMTPGSDNDLYWHVRERCAEIARENGIKFSRVISLLGLVQFSSNRLRKATKPIWEEVVHPIVLVQGVLES